MLKIFVVTSDASPNCFFKAKNAEAARMLFVNGIKPAALAKIEKTLQVKELTMEMLFEMAPDEFTLSEGADF